MQDAKTMTAAIAQPAEEKQVYVDLWRVICRHKWTVLAGGLMGVALGAAAGAWFFGAFDYQSSARVMVIKKRLETAPISEATPAQTAYEDYLASHQVVITSPRIIKDAIQRHRLHELACFPDTSPEKVAGEISRRLSVDRVFKIRGGGPPNNILNAAFDAPDPESPRAVLAAILDSYQRFLLEMHKGANAEALELIGRAREMLQNDIAKKEADYLAFRQNTQPVWNRKDGGTVQLERLFKIDAQRSALRMRQVEIQSTLDQVQRERKNGCSTAELMDVVTGLSARADVITAGLLSPKEPWQGGRSYRTSLEEELINLRLQESKLLENLGPNHDQVVAVRERSNLVRGMITPARNGDGNGGADDSFVKQLFDMKIDLLKQELRDNKRAEESLAGLYDRLQDDAKTSGVNEVLDEMYRKGIERSQLLYESILKRVKELDSVRDYGGFITQVIAEPAPGRRTWRKLALGSGIGLFLGLCLGFAGGLMLDRRDRSLRNPREVRQAFAAPTVDHLPRIEPVVVESSFDRIVYAHHRPQSLEAEALRALRTTLLLQGLGVGQRIVQVTSSGRGEGKSTLAANLAVSLAQAGKKVLLIDADLRSPKQHELFGVNNAIGLSSLLAGNGAVEAAITAVSGVPGLSLLPGGPASSSSAELLSSPRFEDLLNLARQDHDVLLLDSPALLATSDASLIAARAEAVMVVLKLSVTDRQAAQSTRAVLNQLGTKLATVVVNAVPLPRGGARTAIHLFETAEY